jgi:hypothetical protein
MSEEIRPVRPSKVGLYVGASTEFVECAFRLSSITLEAPELNTQKIPDETTHL